MRVGLEHAVHVMHASFRGKHSIYQVPLLKGTSPIIYSPATSQSFAAR